MTPVDYSSQYDYMIFSSDSKVQYLQVSPRRLTGWSNEYLIAALDPLTWVLSRRSGATFYMRLVACESDPIVDLNHLVRCTQLYANWNLTPEEYQHLKRDPLAFVMAALL